MASLEGDLCKYFLLPFFSLALSLKNHFTNTHPAEQTKLLDSISVARKEAEIKVKDLTAALAEEKEARLNLEKAKRKVEDELDETKKQHDFDVERISNLEKLKNELQAEVVC